MEMGKKNHYDWIQQGVYSPPTHIQRTWVIKTLPNYPGLREDGNMTRVIGKKGYHFKKITQESGSVYIWYHSQRNIIEVWAHCETTANSAIHLLHRHLGRFSQPPLSLSS